MNAPSRSHVRSRKPKALKKQGLRRRRIKSGTKNDKTLKAKEIVIDRAAGLVFTSEAELFKHFQPQIDKLENDHRGWLADSSEISDSITHAEFELDLTLEEPQEIWHDPKTFGEFPLFHFIRPLEDMDAYQVAVTYVSAEDEPTFIFLHFISTDLELVNHYRRGELIYDRAFEEVGFGALDGDALSEGDPLAMGLFISMLKVRSEKDISFDDFVKLGAELREETIENADEIWRNADLTGNQIVTFIKEFTDNEIKDLHYIAVTQEDPSSKVHSLLFSFPTADVNLVDRYRHGENLQAEEVTQESSH